MVTIYEVAARAGVSPATVSRVFNGAKVSESKAQRVRDTAAELEFVPNRTARSLRRQASEVIALVLPDIENPYFTEMARGVEDVAQQAGYSVVLCNTDEQAAKEAVYLRIAVSENMAGVIVAPAREESSLETVIGRSRPVVIVDRTTDFDVDRVVMPNVEAARAATGALFDAGYRRVACLTGPAEIDTATDRAAGWREVVQERTGAVPPHEHLFFSTFRVGGGREGAEALLSLAEPPDAIVATNNLMGVGLLQVLAERGLQPPAVGVAVVGGLPFTTLAPSAVTVVRLPAREMGTTAARMLLERIGGTDEPARTVVLSSELQAAASREE